MTFVFIGGTAEQREANSDDQEEHSHTAYVRVPQLQHQKAFVRHMCLLLFPLCSRPLFKYSNSG